MIADLLGIISLALVAFATFIAATRWPYLAKLMLIAFSVRLLASVFNVYIAPLPDSTADAISFERLGKLRISPPHEIMTVAYE